MITKMPGVIVTAALLGACLPATAMEATSEGFPQAQNHTYYHAPGPDLVAEGATAPAGVIGSEYLFLAGSAFTARTSSQSVTYPGAGCTFTDGAVTTSLELPDGTTIIGVRLYYYNMGSPGSVNMFLTAYTGAGGTSDLLTGSSTETTGYASEFFAPVSSLVIDNVGQSYVLTANTSANLRLCGMRVFYAP